MTDELKWEVYLYKEAHVIPQNDTMEHRERISCPCNPLVEVTGNGLVVTHNAQDGREAVEEAERIIEEN